jgi:hypothetical protein
MLSKRIDKDVPKTGIKTASVAGVLVVIVEASRCYPARASAVAISNLKAASYAEYRHAT